VEAEVEGAVMMGLGVGQKVLEVFLSFRLENGIIRRPGAIRELEPVDLILLSSNDGLGMKEKVVFVPKFNPLLSGVFVPKHFFLKEDVIILILQFFFKKSLPHQVNSFQVILDSLESIFNMILSLENVSEDFFVEDNRVLSDFIQCANGVMVGGVPRLSDQVHISIMINPGSLKAERSRTSS